VGLVLVFIAGVAHAQKGGAKGAMRKGGKGGGGGRGGGGGHRHMEEFEDISSVLDNYDYSKPRPCIGLCYIKKLRGDKPIKYPEPARKRKSCVGLCHRRREKGLKRRKTTWKDMLVTREDNKPCVGLCFITKLNKMRARDRTRMTIDEDLLRADASSQDEYDQY